MLKIYDKKIIVITHAPMIGVHDKEDLCHQGFKCFRKFCDKFKPEMWFHGHVHYEGQMREQVSLVGKTKVINVYGVHIIED